MVARGEACRSLGLQTNKPYAHWLATTYTWNNNNTKAWAGCSEWWCLASLWCLKESVCLVYCLGYKRISGAWYRLKQGYSNLDAFLLLIFLDNFLDTWLSPHPFLAFYSFLETISSDFTPPLQCQSLPSLSPLIKGHSTVLILMRFSARHYWPGFLNNLTLSRLPGQPVPPSGALPSVSLPWPDVSMQGLLKLGLRTAGCTELAKDSVSQWGMQRFRTAGSTRWMLGRCSPQHQLSSPLPGLQGQFQRCCHVRSPHWTPNTPGVWRPIFMFLQTVSSDTKMSPILPWLGLEGIMG